MVFLGDEQRSFCCFWDCIQVLRFRLFCWPWWLLGSYISSNVKTMTRGFLWRTVQKWPPISSKLLVPMLLAISFHIHFGFNHVFGFDQWDNSWCDSSRFEHCFHIWDYPHLLHFKPWHVSKSKPACQRMRNMPDFHSDTEGFSQQPALYQIIWLWSDHAGPPRCHFNLLPLSTRVIPNEVANSSSN